MSDWQVSEIQDKMNGETVSSVEFVSLKGLPPLQKE